MSTLPPPSGGFTPSPGGVGPPAARPIDQLRLSYQRRNETDYIFNFWTALGWTILTFGIFGYYVYYQLVRRMRDHNVRRLELLESARAYAWELAGQQGLQEELRPNFEQAAAHEEVMRQMTSDFRDPLIWLLLIWFTGIAGIVLFILLDMDLVKHDTAEGGVESQLATIYARLGRPIPQPDPARIKGKQNYVARVIVSIVTFGIYTIWWWYNMLNEPNQHFEINWAWEDALAQAVQ